MGLVFFTSDTYFRSTSIFFHLRVHACLLTMPPNGTHLFHCLSFYLFQYYSYFSYFFLFHGLGAIGSFSLGLGLIFLLSILHNRVHTHIYTCENPVCGSTVLVLFIVYSLVCWYSSTVDFSICCATATTFVCSLEVPKPGFFFLEWISFYSVFGLPAWYCINAHVSSRVYRSLLCVSVL